MKKLLLTISFLTLLSSALMAKTEIITEEVCNAPAGCRVEMTTGACIGCVSITRTVVSKDIVKTTMAVTRTVVTKDIVKTTMAVSKKVALVAPISFYKYGYPTTAGMNLLTSSIHK